MGAAGKAEEQKALELSPMGEGSNSRYGRVRRAPKRLADEEEGPQWGTPEKPTQFRRRDKGRLPNTA